MAEAAAWLFLPHAPKEKELASQGVIFTSQVIQYPSQMAGIAFPREEWEKIKTIYKIQKVLVEEQTDVGGIILLAEAKEVPPPADPTVEKIPEPKEEPAKKLVTFNPSHLENISATDWLEPMLSKIANEIEAEFVVHCAHGNMERIPPVSTNPNTIDICFWAAPTIGMNSTPSKFCDNTINKLWDVELPAGSDDASSPQPDIDVYGGYDISDGKMVAAQIIGTSVYVLNDLCHYGSKEPQSKVCITITEHILEDVKNIFQTLKKRQECIADFVDKKANESKMKFVAALKRRSSARVSELKKGYEENIMMIQQHSTEIEKCVSRNIDLSRQILGHECGEEKVIKMYEIEYEKLMQYPYIEALTGTNDELVVETKCLYTNPLEDDGTVRLLGRYRINIPFSSGGNIRVTNLDGKVVNLDHPHSLNSRGEVCWGNMSAPIKKLKENYEFTVLLQVIIDFLQSVNLEDVYGTRVKKWSVVDPVTKEFIRKGDE